MYIVEIDKSSLSGKHKLYEHDAKLDEFVHAVSLAKPLLNFVATDDLCKSVYRTFKTNDGEIDRRQCNLLTGVEVYQNGEKLGEIGIADIYRRNEGQVYVYTVSSFRIDKERGDHNKTLSKDIKVSLRIAKKVLVSRANEEVCILIKKVVDSKLNSISNQCETEVRWSIDSTTEGMFYATQAYEARLRGETTLSLPVTLKSIKDMKEHNKRFAEAMDAITLKNAFKSNKGYGLQTLSNGSIYALDFSNGALKRYKEFDELPLDIQNKYGMAKVLKEDEPASNIGVWSMHNDMHYMYIAP